MQSRIWMGFLASAALLAAGCGEGPSAPVARLDAEPAALSLPHGGEAVLTTRWQMTGPLEGSGDAVPHVFVHLVDEDGRVLRTFDHRLPFPWLAGAEAEDRVELWQSALDPPLPPGSYGLHLGLYDPASGRRWALDPSGGEEAGKQAYAVARVEVPAGAGSGPRLTFSGGWHRPEVSRDLQVLTRRWMEKSGEVAIAGLAGPTLLELVARIPQLPAGEHSLVFDEGAGAAEAAAPALRILAGCGGGETLVQGFGEHRISLPLEPAAGGEGCPLLFEANFVYIETASPTLTRRSVSLEKLTWKPA